MKICSGCQESKPLSEYHKWARSADGHYHKCKPCRKVYDANHYKNNEHRRKTIKDTNKRIRVERREKYRELKSSLSCIDCGNDNPIVLEFDHLSDKEFTISQMISHSPWEEILREIDKCEPVCANCHRIRTHNRRVLGV